MVSEEVDVPLVYSAIGSHGWMGKRGGRYGPKKQYTLNPSQFMHTIGRIRYEYTIRSGNVRQTYRNFTQIPTPDEGEFPDYLRKKEGLLALFGGTHEANFVCPQDRCEDGQIGECQECEEGEISCEHCGGEAYYNCSECEGDGQIQNECEECGGTGWITEECEECSGEEQVECEECDGEGYDSCEECEGSGEVEDEKGKSKKCPECEGSGQGEECEDCEGEGQIECDECGGEGEKGHECEECSGSGEVTEECEECSGEGQIECEECDGGGTVYCDECEGEWQEQECWKCDGLGKIPHPRGVDETQYVVTPTEISREKRVKAWKEWDNGVKESLFGKNASIHFIPLAQFTLAAVKSIILNNNKVFSFLIIPAYLPLLPSERSSGFTIISLEPMSDYSEDIRYTTMTMAEGETGLSKLKLNQLFSPILEDFITSSSIEGLLIKTDIPIWASIPLLNFPMGVEAKQGKRRGEITKNKFDIIIDKK